MPPEQNLEKYRNKIRGCRQVQIISPTGFVTGGTESLFNLCAQMRSLSINAVIVPYGGGKPTKASRLDSFGCPMAELCDDKEVLVIVPEILPMLALSIKNAVVGIWWLSRDNFKEVKYNSPRDSIRYSLAVLKGKRPFGGVRALQKLLHFSKAKYDADYLSFNGIENLQLVGPISSDFLPPVSDKTLFQRRDVVLYNPKKGYEITSRIINEMRHLEFIPLTGLANIDLRYLYQTSKIYIDFGHHPGQERMPREAVSMGCCILVGGRGASGNSVDMPIPNEYKISPGGKDFNQEVQNQIEAILSNFDLHFDRFNDFRAKVASEPRSQVETLKLLFQE